jgi:hypothetical protein
MDPSSPRCSFTATRVAAHNYKSLAARIVETSSGVCLPFVSSKMAGFLRLRGLTRTGLSQLSFRSLMRLTIMIISNPNKYARKPVTLEGSMASDCFVSPARERCVSLPLSQITAAVRDEHRTFIMSRDHLAVLRCPRVGSNGGYYLTMARN